MVSGRPGTRLAALSRDFDLLVCGSRGYGPMRSVALGAVSHTLVNEAACPVLVLPRRPRRSRLFRPHDHDAVMEA